MTDQEFIEHESDQELIEQAAKLMADSPRCPKDYECYLHEDCLHCWLKFLETQTIDYRYD